MKIIYEPKGAAREYAELAANLFAFCPHGCTYCYAGDLRRTKPLDVLKALDEDAGVLQKRYSKMRQDELTYDGAGTPPVLFCFTCDPYPPQEGELLITRRALQILHSHGLNFTILTKGGELAQRDFDLYQPGDSFGVTLTLTDREAQGKYEPGAADYEERISNLFVANAVGIRTWVSCEPVIYPAQTLELLERTADYVDEYKIGKLNHGAPPEPVDWRQFAIDAISLCERMGKKYTLKSALKQYLRSVDKKLLIGKERKENKCADCPDDGKADKCFPCLAGEKSVTPSAMMDTVLISSVEDEVCPDTACVISERKVSCYNCLMNHFAAKQDAYTRREVAVWLEAWWQGFVDRSRSAKDLRDFINFLKSGEAKQR